MSAFKYAPPISIVATVLVIPVATGYETSLDIAIHSELFLQEQ